MFSVSSNLASTEVNMSLWLMDPLLHEAFIIFCRHCKKPKDVCHCMQRCLKLSDNVSLSWSTYHAAIETSDSLQACIQSLIPLFRDTFRSPVVIRHAMDLITKAENYLNPGQVSILKVDEPLHEISK